MPNMTSNNIFNLDLKVVLNIIFNLFITVKYILMRVKTQKCKTYSISFLLGECVNDDQLVTIWATPSGGHILYYPSFYKLIDSESNTTSLGSQSKHLKGRLGAACL